MTAELFTFFMLGVIWYFRSILLITIATKEYTRLYYMIDEFSEEETYQRWKTIGSLNENRVAFNLFKWTSEQVFSELYDETSGR